MNAVVHPGRLSGTIRVPGSKSHTIRALAIAALAHGTSTISAPLDSGDTASCIGALRALGVPISEKRGSDGNLEALVVEGTGGRFTKPLAPLDCGNSGTTFYILLSVAALASFPVTLTGDEQLRLRSAEALLQALEMLGVSVERIGEEGCAPVTVTGPIAGGAATVECQTSQYLTSLLLATPLAASPTQIVVPVLNERPYVEMTLSWLESQQVSVSRDGWSRFVVDGNTKYSAFERQIPGDFSAATFFAAAAAAQASQLTLAPLDLSDSQGDKAVIANLESLGCTVTSDAGTVTIAGPENGISGGSLDLNAMPDALPALAVLGTTAGSLKLVNVAHARAKETDRIAVMAGELRRLGADIRERPDGLEIRSSQLSGGSVASHGDHRVAMALAVAGLIASGPVTVQDAACVSITFPDFFEQLRAAGARVEIGDS